MCGSPQVAIQTKQVHGSWAVGVVVDLVGWAGIRVGCGGCSMHRTGIEPAMGCSGGRATKRHGAALGLARQPSSSSFSLAPNGVTFIISPGHEAPDGGKSPANCWGERKLERFERHGDLTLQILGR